MIWKFVSIIQSINTNPCCWTGFITIFKWIVIIHTTLSRPCCATSRLPYRGVLQNTKRSLLYILRLTCLGKKHYLCTLSFQVWLRFSQNPLKPKHLPIDSWCRSQKGILEFKFRCTCTGTLNWNNSLLNFKILVQSDFRNLKLTWKILKPINNHDSQPSLIQM